jgi:peptidoglycan/xylan/chitin deacetylase (PgdA/CDA1 family)
MIRLARNIWRSVAPGAIVLLYHRINQNQLDPWSLCVTPSNFAEQLAILRRHCRPVRLQDLVAACRNGRVLRRAVVVTFDDGYADNLLNAQPLLEREDIAATIFIATQALDQAFGEFWWDELARQLLMPGALPASLALRIGGRDYGWGLGPSASYSAADAARHAGWIAWGEDMPTARHAIYRALWELLHPLPAGEQQSVLAQLGDWAGSSLVDPTNRTLRPEEIRALSQAGVVEIGAHTITHPTLSALALADQRHEIQQSKAQLEAIVERPIRSFSYPFGRRSDYSHESIALVREAGFSCACSNWSGGVGRKTDLFQLPRFNVPDCDGATFERQLASWFRTE